ncbi:MAG: DUF4168 domain-containing protein [Scytonema sp. RU_4_4]|nr:DUF4168 domain-containing protein [Scytonema sp. RU_4_4]NJR75543.1 DUF4168 domain-containing protein [Scytonema sp. CRU_2_7]
MFKQILIGSYVFVFLLVSSLSAHAQQAPKPTSPSSQPQVPITPQTSGTKVSQEELQKFASSLKQLLVIEQGANQQITEIVSKSGLSEQRFLEINKAQQNPSQPPAQAITPQEKQQFDKAFTSLRSVQQEANTKMQQVLQKEGLQAERFKQINAAVRQDPTLQQKVREMIKS